MSDREYWRDNLEMVAHETLHYATSVPAAIEALEDVGNIALYRDTERDIVYSTEDILDALRDLREALPADPEDEDVRVNETGLWNGMRQYFTSEEQIRTTVGELYVTRHDDVMVTSKSGY